MREVVCFDKNLITGEINTVKKYKPKSMTQGKVTVSLFDESGNKIREAKTENLVYDWIKPWAFKQAYELNFGIGTYGPSQGTTNITSTQSCLEGLSKYIMLFNGNHDDVNTKQALIKDTLVGYAGRYLTYSGGSTQQGTYNSAESNIGVDDNGNLVFHMVYDFPTHAANGTITGVGMGSNTSSSNVELFSCKYSNFEDDSYGIGQYTSGVWSNKDWSLFAGLFATNTNSSSYSLNVVSRYNDLFRKIRDNTIATNVSLPTTSQSTATHYGYTGYDMENKIGYVNYVHQYSTRIGVSQGANKPISPYEVYLHYRTLNTDGTVSTHEITIQDDLLQFLDIKDPITSSSTSNYVYVRLTPIVTKEGTILCHMRTEKEGNSSVYSDTKDKNFILCIDKDGYIIGSEEITQLIGSTTSTSTYCKWVYYGDEVALLVPSSTNTTYCINAVVCGANLENLRGVPIEDLNYIGNNKIDKQITKKLSYYHFIGNMNRAVIGLADSGVTQRHVFDEGYRKLSSYTKLPSPIIKTNTNTMKVQYDIVIEDIDPYEYIEYANRG